MLLAKFRNWLLPVLLALAGSAEMFIGLFSEIVKDAGLPSYYVHVFRMVALFMTVVLIKKEPPSYRKVEKQRLKRIGKLDHVQNEEPT
ncbi:hypothetical protein GR160_02830 [Flavobacterium sp. Sd200]|uniref:hypothetical protein n=1 Tax=Flavobacterium sp. Sd200 TaxID=2692211 RepID=UPI00136E2FAD|nr:hypothetical protein [Flavobacterium sp. Sd200]MXN90148.1 hypothetical protein [Flavobacterium sp. Sd200]